MTKHYLTAAIGYACQPGLWRMTDMKQESICLQKMYQPDDGNTQVFALEDCTAVFSSFTEEPRTLKF